MDRKALGRLEKMLLEKHEDLFRQSVDAIVSCVQQGESEHKAARMCPVCAGDSKVCDSREQLDGTIIRKRKCLTCDHRFLTCESYSRSISP